MKAAEAALGLNLHTSYADLPTQFHRPARQAPLGQASLFAFNQPLAASLGLNPEADENSLLHCFNSAEPPAGGTPVHMAYGGHQFGNWVPQLGDGRSLLLGEVATPTGELIDLQIKGSGTGHFSRGFDGRAVLRSTIREYLCSEAMHHLGIPTTRALCLINSQEPVRREQMESGALLVRTARSHVRFGTFEYFHYQSDTASVETLVHYVMRRHFPSLAGDNDNPAGLLLGEAILATARTLAAWQVAGFCHGVMNTDNMSILGETLDYGPFGFMDTYLPGHICNSSDSAGRYAYNRQPAVGLWNCQALAAALTSLLPESKANEYLQLYEPELLRCYLAGMGRRLGLTDTRNEDLPLISEWLDLLARSEGDYQQSFRRLGEYLQQGRLNEMAQQFSDTKGFDRWCAQWMERAGADGPDTAMMRCHNPAVVLRNSYAQTAIAAAQRGEVDEFNRLLAVLQKPFDDPAEMRYSEPPSADEAGISLSCSA